MSDLVIIGCGKGKRSVASPARDLYTGTYIRNAVRWSDSIGATILILSAKYGLVDADQVIEPYEASLSVPGSYGAPQVDAERSVSPAVVRRQVRDRGLSGPVITLAGKAYLAMLRQADLEPYNPFFDLARHRFGDARSGYQSMLMKEYAGTIPQVAHV
jgi:hypothetical protein